MKTILRVGNEKYVLNENGKNTESKFSFSGLANQVPLFMYMMQEVDKKFISMRYPTDEQIEVMEINDQIDSGLVPFETEEELQAFYERYDEVMSEGVCNQEILDLGGIELIIEGDKFKLDYEFDGDTPSEKIYGKDGNLLAEISRDKLYIEGINGKIIYDKNFNVIYKDFYTDNYISGVDMVLSNLNEGVLTSVGVLGNEFEDNKDLQEAIKKIYSKAYVEKDNALRNIISYVVNDDNSLSFLIGVEEEVIDEGIKMYPDKQFIYSVK